MNGMKNKIWVVFMEKDNAFHMKFTEKDTIKACKPKNVVLRYKIMSKCVEGDSCLQKPTGIRRHRLRTLFGGGDEGNTLEQTD